MNKTFNYRHDFDAQDLKVLKNNFPEIIFKDIPEAWICKIDSMLLSFNLLEQEIPFLKVGDELLL